MDGQFITALGNDYVYENVTMYLSHSNGSLIEARQLGTLDETVSVSVVSEEIPAYVYIDSPDFWKQDNFAVYYYEYRGGDGVQYRQEWAKSRSELPVNQSTTDSDS